MAAAINASACRGCVPATTERRSSSEAYALMWVGNAVLNRSASTAFTGLAVAVHSIRQHDAVRPIVIMTAEEERALPPRDGPPTPGPGSALSLLAERYAPLHVVRVPYISVSPQSRCYISAGKQVQTRESALRMLTKFNIFALTRFACCSELTRVLYLDADVLVTRPLEQLWRLQFERWQIAAAARTTDRRPNCTFPRQAHYSQHNAGVQLVRQSEAVLATLLAVLPDPLVWRVSCANGDQWLWNRMLAFTAPRPSHVRCIGHSFNCYHPEFVGASQTPLTAGLGYYTMCSDETTATSGVKWLVSNDEDHMRELRKLDPKALVATPHVLHFATMMKPWRQQLSWGLRGGGGRGPARSARQPEHGQEGVNNRSGSTYALRLWDAARLEMLARTMPQQ